MVNFAEINMESLLGREPVSIDMTPAAELIRGRRVLVSGAAGSIGSELSRQLLRLEPARLVILDRAETPLHDLELELGGDDTVCVAIGDCSDKAAMTRLFAECRPEIVFHAAAYKHVPMMERSPHAAVANNIGSTRLLADLAAAFGAERFVMVSTDKAVNPTNVMGASKRACELYVQSRSAERTRFITTRFGNVLGSQGSVIPLFLHQIARGGPLTVTHPEVRRYFMLISEACRLVLLAAAQGHGGEIFAFDMGQQVRIADLARRVAVLYGTGLEQIVFTGLRPGEKLYEEVLTSDERTLPGPHPKIKAARVRPAERAAVEPAIDALLALAADAASSPESVVAALKRLVPEFKSRNSPYSSLD